MYELSVCPRVHRHFKTFLPRVHSLLANMARHPLSYCYDPYHIAGALLAVRPNTKYHIENHEMTPSETTKKKQHLRGQRKPSHATRQSEGGGRQQRPSAAARLPSPPPRSRRPRGRLCLRRRRCRARSRRRLPSSHHQDGHFCPRPPVLRPPPIGAAGESADQPLLACCCT